MTYEKLTEADLLALQERWTSQAPHVPRGRRLYRDHPMSTCVISPDYTRHTVDIDRQPMQVNAKLPRRCPWPDWGVVAIVGMVAAFWVGVWFFVKWMTHR